MAEYIEYHPLKFWLDPASIAEIVAHIQTYLVNNPINSTTEIETIIHDYLIAHPELIGGVDSVNGQTGEVVLTADNISGGENVTIKDVLDSLQDQIDDIVASIPSDYQQLINDVSDLKSAINVLDVVKEQGEYTFSDIEFVNKVLSSSTGELSIDDNLRRISSFNYLFVPDGCTFTITTQSGFTVNTICQYDKNGEFLGSGSIKISGCYYFRFTGYKGDASVEITPTEAETAFTPSLNYTTKTDELQVKISQNKTDISTLSKRVTNLDNIETFENILLTLSKWQSSAGHVNYSTSDSRVSTPSGTVFECFNGDIIGLTDYSGIQFRVGYTTDDGASWNFGNWQSADYVCQSDGKYIVTIMNTTETKQSDAWALGHLFYVKHLFRNDVVIQQADLQNESSISFVWASDTHHQIHNGALYGTSLDLIKQMSKMSNDINADFFTITGDIVNGYYPVSEQKNNLVNVVRMVKDNTPIPKFIVEGNHDDNSWYASGDSTSTSFKGMTEILTNAQFTTYSMNNTINDVHIDLENPLGGYYYKDFEKSKTRVIVLNVIDIPYQMNSAGTGLVFYGQYTFGFQNKQLTWLAHDALKFEESGWSVIFIMHFDGNMTYTDYETKNIAGLNEIVNAYRNNLSGTYESQVPNFRGTVVYDFTTNPSNTVTAWFSGHCHADHAELIDGVPHLTIINAFNPNGGGYDLVTVDKTNKTITTKRYNGFALSAYNRSVTWS